MRHAKTPGTWLLASALIAQLALLGNCGGQPRPRPTPLPAVVESLPPPVRQFHDDSRIFQITWFPTPYPGYSKYVGLQADGRISGGIDHGSWMESGLLSTVLATEARAEIPTLLEDMVQMPSVDPFSGATVITLSFLWRGDYHIVSYNEASCPRALHRLLEIATAEGNPCQNNHEYPRQTGAEGVEGAPWSDLPDWVRCLHGASLFRAAWFEPPFDDTLGDAAFDSLSLYVHYLGQAGSLFVYNPRCLFTVEPGFAVELDRSEVSDRLCEQFSAHNHVLSPAARVDVVHPGSYWIVADADGEYAVQSENQTLSVRAGDIWYGKATEADRQEAQAILASLVEASSDEPSPGDTVITLGFSWEGDYHLLTFGGSSCPAQARRLFEIADLAFRRYVPEEGIPNPCRNAPVSP